jgi:hypothetical protein
MTLFEFSLSMNPVRASASPRVFDGVTHSGCLSFRC